MVERRRILLINVMPRVPQPITLCVWSVSDRDAGISVPRPSLTATKTTMNAAWSCVRGTTAMGAGQWYWETQVSWSGSADFAVGVATAAAVLAVKPGTDAAGASIGVSKDGAIRWKNAIVGNVGAIANGARVRLWLDMDSFRLLIAVNGGAWQTYRIDMAMAAGTATGFFLKPIVGLYWPSGAAPSATGNFGASPFTYQVPEGVNPGAYVESVPIEETLYIGSEGFDHVALVDPGLVGVPPYWDYENAIRYLARISVDADVETEREGGCWVWGGQSVSRPGQVSLVNVDGGLDAWLDYDWRDAPITLLSGYEGDTLADFTVWTETTVDHIESTREGLLILHLADPLALFDRALQPTLYPDNQQNPQAAGQPKGIVIGRPLYCEGVLLDTDPAVRDVQLLDGLAGIPSTSAGLSSIESIYDRGNRFAGPDDPYSYANPITAGGIGSFTTWAPDTAGIQMPANWTRVTGFSAADRFQQGAAAGTLRMLSTGQAWTAIYVPNATATHSAGRRYKISFDVTALGKSGQIIFRFDGNAPGMDDVVVPITSTGPVTAILDCTDANYGFQIVIGRTELDCTIDNLKTETVQVIDWTYLVAGADRVGFHLTNKAAGKIVANPVGPTYAGVVIERLGLVINHIMWRTWIGAGYAGLPPLWSMTGGFGEANYRIATYERRPRTALSLMREVMDCWCGWIVPTRSGSIGGGRVVDPSKQYMPALTLDSTNILDGVSVSDDLAKGLTVRLSGRRNHAVHNSDGDLSSTISPALRAELTTEMTITRTGAPVISSAPVSAAYAQAIGAPAKQTLLQDAADIQAEANRVATLWRPKRQFFAVTALLGASTADALEPGMVVRLNWRGRSRNLLVVGVRSRFFSRRVDLKLWG